VPVPGSPPLIIRPYRSPDDAAPTFEAFRSAIRVTASAVYQPHQIDAWAGPPRTDLGGWDDRRRTATTLVAELDGAVVGFSDLLPDGLVDMLYVAPGAGRRGVARALVTEIKLLAQVRGIRELYTHASRSAQPAFQRFGFTVTADRPDNSVRGVVVPNAEMRCLLSD
jgi:putative acetyltransferase